MRLPRRRALSLVTLTAALSLSACGNDGPSDAPADVGGADEGSGEADAGGSDALEDTWPSCYDRHTPAASATRPDLLDEVPAYAAAPEPPRIMRDVAMINDDVEFVRPFVPGHRTTMDGRVGIRVQGGPPGTIELKETLSFYLFVPERLQAPIMDGPPGAEILADPEPFNVPFPPALLPGIDRTGHHAICDPTQEFAVEGEKTNPYVCGPDGRNDCYDFVVVSTTSPLLNAQIWGTPVTVEVENPKTPDARIIRAELGESVKGFEIPVTNEWTEPAVTIDGRLLTGRLGRVPREWTNPVTGETIVRPIDLAYSVLPEEFEPCDVRGWTEFHPMSFAPYDPNMVGRYGLAAYPFRDGEGHPIPAGEDLGGTYPWVDREGANVFMAVVPGRVVEQSMEKFPRRCVHEGCESYAENTDWDRGFMVGGLWTHGKFVLLDAMINNQDWAVGVTPAAHYWVDLYTDAAGAPVPVRFGSGRFIDAVRNAGGPYPPGYTHNANILDSLQNLFTYHGNTRPVTPRDVVWHMSTGVATDEVEFDDFVDTTAFIVSNMHASMVPHKLENGMHTSFPKHWNGQVRIIRNPAPIPSLNVLHPELDEEIHVQNAATTLFWNPPAYGLVDAGAGRIEPVALGGIKGRGFWLNGDNTIRYEIAAQPRPVDQTPWYVGVFVDTRGAANELRTLLTFPDGSAVRVAGSTYVEYVAGGEVVHAVAVPAASGWAHVALAVEAGNRTVTLLHNGYAIDRASFDAPLFQFTPGTFAVGAAAGAAGFRGWIDELKVFAYALSPEVACNNAFGTLVRVDDNATWAAHAARHPDWAHAAVAAAAGEEGCPQFACVHDYSRDYAAHLGNLPPGTTSVRDAIIFPEGPLRYGEPRPDSTQNAFCLSCHTDQSRAGLHVSALAIDPSTPAEDDRRRQPMQPPRRVLGNIPPGWIAPGAGPGSPAEHLQAPREGLPIDAWVLPHAR